MIGAVQLSRGVTRFGREGGHFLPGGQPDFELIEKNAPRAEKTARGQFFILKLPEGAVRFSFLIKKFEWLPCTVQCTAY